MSNSRIMATYVLALAIFSFAGALLYVAVVVSQVSRELPSIVDSISQISDKVESVTGEIDKVRDLVPAILQEVEQVRAQIPAILKETAAIREQVPSVVASLDKASDAVVTASKEVEASRPVVTELTMQINTTTKAIPPILDHAEEIVNKAEGIGSKAGMQVVAGAVTGIVTSPFTVMNDIGRILAGNSDQVAGKYKTADYMLIEEVALTLCHDHNIGTSMEWNNSASSNHGTVTLKSVHDSSRKKCCDLTVKTMTDGKFLGETEITICREDGGEWHIAK